MANNPPSCGPPPNDGAAAAAAEPVLAPPPGTGGLAILGPDDDGPLDLASATRSVSFFSRRLFLDPHYLLPTMGADLSFVTAFLSFLPF